MAEGYWTSEVLRKAFKQEQPSKLRTRLRWILDWSEAAGRFESGKGNQATFGILPEPRAMSGSRDRVFTIYAAGSRDGRPVSERSGMIRIFLEPKRCPRQPIREALFHGFDHLGLFAGGLTLRDFGESRNSIRTLADLSDDEMDKVMELIMLGAEWRLL